MVFMEFEEGGGALEVAVATLAAVGLDFEELLESPLELARKALAVEAQGGDGAVGVHDVELDRGLFGGRVLGAGEEVGFE